MLIAVSKSALDEKTLEAVQSLNNRWCMRPPPTGPGFALAGGSTPRSRETASISYLLGGSKATGTDVFHDNVGPRVNLESLKDLSNADRWDADQFLGEVTLIDCFTHCHSWTVFDVIQR